MKNIFLSILVLFAIYTPAFGQGAGDTEDITVEIRQDSTAHEYGVRYEITYRINLSSFDLGANPYDQIDALIKERESQEEDEEEAIWASGLHELFDREYEPIGELLAEYEERVFPLVSLCTYEQLAKVNKRAFQTTFRYDIAISCEGKLQGVILRVSFNRRSDQQDIKPEALTCEDCRSYFNALSSSLPKVSWESELFRWGWIMKPRQFD